MQVIKISMVKKKIQNNQKFVILLICSLFFIAAMIVLSIFIGAEKSITLKILSTLYLITTMKILMKQLLETLEYLE